MLPVSEGPKAAFVDGNGVPDVVGILRVLGFFDRVGGMLVRPRVTLAQVLSGRGGLSDVSWLLALRLLAGDSANLIARAVLGASVNGVPWAVRELLQAAATLLPEIGGILVGSIMLTLLRGKAARGREIDLAACAWIPFLAVRVLEVLGYTLLQISPSPVEEHVFDALALGWSAIAFAIAYQVAHRQPASQIEAPAAAGTDKGSAT